MNRLIVFACCWFLFENGISQSQTLKIGPEDSLLAKQQVDSLIQLTREFTRTQDYEGAFKINAMAAELAIEKFGKVSSAYGLCRLSKGKLHLGISEYEEAETCYLDYSSIMEQARGKEHPDYAWSLDNLGQLYQHLGQFGKAESFFKQSGSILEKIYGKEHPEYAWSLNDLAVLYRVMGYYEKAEPLYLQARAIREKALGKEHSDYAWSLNNLANLYMVMGRYDMAEPLYLEAASIWEKEFGREHPYYASCRNNMAAMYYNMGIFDKAAELFAEAVEIRGKTLGKENQDYAGSLDNLASVLMERGDYQKVEALFLEAKTIREKVLGKEHPEWATSLHNLAILYKLMGRNDEAESFFLEANRIWESTLGKEHPEYATNLFNLAAFYLEQDRLDKAEPLFKESGDIWKRLFGSLNADYSECLGNLALLEEKLGRHAQTDSLAEEYSSINQKLLAKACSFLSEQELSQYMVKFLHRMEDLCAYNNARLQGAKRNPGRVLPALVYNDALFYKGFLLASAIRMNTLAETSPVAGEPYQKLKAIRRRLANLYTLPVAERSGVGELEVEAANTEKELSRLLAGYSDASRQVDWREIKSGLKSGEAALEFIHYQHLFPKPSDRILYAALLIRPQDEVPVFIPLCEEASLDSILQVKADRKADYVNGLYTLADRGAYIPKTSQRTLYELLCKPLEKELTGLQTIYFSPSGLLHRINLNAIPVNEMETLSDRYRLIELTSTRQLVTPNPPVDQNRDAVLYGAVNYDLDAGVQTNEVVAASQSRGSLSFNAADGPQSKGSWGFLTGTEREVHSIEKTLQMNGFKVVLAKGENATEASIKKFGSGLAASPRVIHIATHGFFFPDPDRTNSAEDGMTRDSSSSERTAIAASQNNSQQPIDNSPSGSEFIKSDQPMLRSGLILAGGNAAWQGQPARKGQEDGVLTAYEIAQMNLSNTELVVLSACETGLGDIQGNEGVYGLQRAFKIAGVKYLIMSLWQVPDKQTSMLMIAFYKNWLDQKMSIPDAFHAAQKELRELGFDPYQWAGFVLIE